MMDVSQVVWRQLRRVYRQERVSMDDHVGARELENNWLGFWGENHFLRWELFSLDFTDERLFEKAWEGNAFRARIDLRWSSICKGGEWSAICGTKRGLDRNASLWSGSWLWPHWPPTDGEIAKLKHFSPKQLHSSQTIASCQRCDLDRDGKLDYQEFRAMIFRSRERKEALLREEQEQASQASAQRTAFLFISMMASSFFSSWYWWSRFIYSNVSGQVEREEKVSWEKEEEGANKQEKGEKGEKGRKKEEVKRSLPSNCCTQYKKHSEIKHTKRISLKRVIGRLFVLTHVETFILIFDFE